MNLFRTFFLLTAAQGFASLAYAQSTAQPVLPGILVTSGCNSGYLSCYVPYSNSNPLPVLVAGSSSSSEATATAAAPSYTEGTVNPISQNLTGDQRVIAKQSGTWTNTVTQATGTNLHTVTDTGSTTAVTGNVAITATSLPLPTGASTSANQPSQAAQGSTTSGQTGTLEMMATTTAPPTDTNGQTNPRRGDTHGAARIVPQDTNGTVADFTAATLVVSTQQLPNAATASYATATGTTAATTATLASQSGKTNFLCGFSIRANATAAATGNATVTGILGGTLNFTQWTAPLATNIGLVEERFSPCLQASGVTTAIAVVSAAPGTGGTVSVTADGYFK